MSDNRLVAPCQVCGEDMRLCVEDQEVQTAFLWVCPNEPHAPELLGIGPTEKAKIAEWRAEWDRTHGRTE